MAGPRLAQLDIVYELDAATTTLGVFYAVMTLPGSYLITAARFIPNPTSTAGATNTTTLTLTNGATTIGAWDTTTGQDGTLTAGTDVAFPLDGTGSQLVLAQNDVLKLTKSIAAAGVKAHGRLSLLLEHRPL